MIKKALSIAGSDSGGGAGIQADLKTFQELEVFGMTALTAVTAQNTLGVQSVYPMTADAVVKQIESIGEDIGADAVKTGMLFNAEIIEAVSESLKYYQWDNIVVDPVMIAKGGASLLQLEAISAMKQFLLPISKVITPNIPEAEVLTGMSIRTLNIKKKLPKDYGRWVWRMSLLKAAMMRIKAESVDLLFDGKEFYRFSSKRIKTKNTHGTGCTFSAVITAELAKGQSVYEAVLKAKDFIQAAIEEGIEIGHGHGPTNHWAFRKKNLKE